MGQRSKCGNEDSSESSKLVSRVNSGLVFGKSIGDREVRIGSDTRMA